MTTRPFLVCLHDGSPAHARETRAMLRDLGPRVGRRIAVGVVPDWHGRWPLAEHPGFCRAVGDATEEILLHGYSHRRRCGFGPVTLLTGGCDEMNGLDAHETLHLLERGQLALEQAFGRRARGFLAPGWQPGHVHPRSGHVPGLDYSVGFFSLTNSTGRSLPLATWTWDCGRPRWLGHVGHGIGRLLHALDGRIPVLAIHPADLRRGFWPRIVRLVDELLATGHRPTTPSRLLEDAC